MVIAGSGRIDDCVGQYVVACCDRKEWLDSPVGCLGHVVRRWQL